MTRTVLVTGVGGFVGSHVVEALLERTDWRVIGLDSFRHSGQFDHLVAVGGHDTSRVEAWVHDLNVPLSRRRVRELVDLELDYVVNVASGVSTPVATGGVAEWFDDDTVVVGDGT